jgi:hypothetical protein
MDDHPRASVTDRMSGALPGQSCWTLADFFSFSILYAVGTTPWMGDQPVARPLPTHRTQHRINAHIYPSLEWDSNPRSLRSSERPSLTNFRTYDPIKSTLVRLTL